MKRILDHRGDTVSVVHYDEMTDRTTISSHQDCTDILENNKRLQTMNDGYSPTRGLKRIASIPMGLATQWVQEAGIKQEDFWSWPKRAQNEFFRQHYMSSDYAHVRTS